MTLAALLEELKQVDLDVFAEIDLVSEVWSGFSITANPNTIFHHMIQGCIQRACERRGWTWRVFRQTPDNEKSHCGEIGKVAPGYEGDYYEQYHEYCIASIEADSAAEALLVAYIAAVREEAK